MICKRGLPIIISLLCLLSFSSCGVYSFTGASIAPDIETISIQYFFNDAGNGPPTLQQTFTEKIRDYFQQNTNLELVENNGDLQIEGSIVQYNVKPVTVSASGNRNTADLANTQRLTIAVKASYVNTKDDTFNFSDKNFSFYDDFDAGSTTITAVEDQLIETIADQIILDIFNASVANW